MVVVFVSQTISFLELCKVVVPPRSVVVYKNQTVVPHLYNLPFFSFFVAFYFLMASH